MKASKDECHIIDSNNEHVSMKIDDMEVESSVTAWNKYWLKTQF